METLTPDLPERRRILRQICHSHAQWKVRIAIAAALFLIALGIMGFFVILLITYPTSEEGVIASVGAAICLACVPFFIALSVKNTAKFKCAFPYTSYANGSLRLHSDKLEYAFWRVGPREPAAYSSRRAVYRDGDKFVYIINRKDVRSIEIQEDICKIKGNGVVQMPEWAEEDASVKRTNKEFSFIMAFAQKNAKQLIEAWSK